MNFAPKRSGDKRSQFWMEQLRLLNFVRNDDKIPAYAVMTEK